MRIHFVGISGVSMRALASFASARGHIVSGSDRDKCGHDKNNVHGCDLVVYTNAVPQDNCELTEARRLGIPTVERATYLGELAATYDNVIAIAGCHGKSTATAMLGAAFAGRKATVHVGVKDCSHTGSCKYFITEACEYRASFLHLRPTIGVILNVQYDHPDFYRTESELIAAYAEFARLCKTVIVNGNDDKSTALVEDPITFGIDGDFDYRAENIKNNNGFRSFDLTGKKRAHVDLSVAGQHSVMNALACIAAASEAGLSLTEILPGLKKFTGIPRRFERKGIAFGKTVFTDYAHHPTEIAATIRTAKEIFPSVAVVFQPHTYSRTKSLSDEFVAALSLADTVVLAPIFAAREQPIPGVTSHALCRKIIDGKKEKAYCFDAFPEIIDYCKNIKDKALIFMGAGDIDKAADKFMEEGSRPPAR